VLLVISSVFITYIASGILAHPHWGEAARGLVVPDLPFQRHAILVATATLGTTLAPWGLAFIQSYAVDKKLKPSDWKFERIDVVVGAVSTGVIGLFVVVACAETLYRSHTHINDASDAAVALTPLAGHLASTLFAVGLVGAGLLAAAILSHPGFRGGCFDWFPLFIERVVSEPIVLHGAPGTRLGERRRVRCGAARC
jgi:Mn2+/Fe2+ NRAMP family transporter